MNKIKYLLLLILCGSLSMTYAQKRISGHVFSKSDGPVMMANVLEVDNNNRTVSASMTDMNGNFSMSILNPKNRLKVSYVGYATWSEAIGNRTVFKIEMRDNSIAIKDAVVRGKKQIKSNGLTIPEREVSIAQQSLNMDDMQGLSFESADQALQGQIAGLDVVANSGNLGSGTSMRLRGTTTITGDQNPLIVVDGNILESLGATDIDIQNMDNNEQFAQLLQVNPDDIQSITVKKDAASTAIWGSRGANGVIEIQTRRGKKGKTKVEFSYRFSDKWQPEGMSMLNGDGYTMMLKEGYFNPSQNSSASNIVELNYDQERRLYYANFNKNTDWVKEISQSGMTHDYNLNISGGGEKATFRISGGYNHEVGTVIEQSLDRFTTRMVLDYYVSDRIKFSSNFSLTYTSNNKNFTDNVLGAAYNAMPNMSLYRHEYDYEKGAYYNTGEYFKMFPVYSNAGVTPDGYTSNYLGDMADLDKNGGSNPYAIAKLAWRKQKSYAIQPQFQLEYKLLGIDDNATQLTYTGEVYLNANSLSDDNYYPSELTNKKWTEGINLAGNSESNSLNFTTRHTLIFTPRFKNEDHNLTAMVRAEMSTSNSNNQSMSSSGLASGVTDPTVNAYLQSGGTSTGKSHNMGVLGSFHYAFKGKYAFDATLRADGSTKFGKDKRWGYFPGISGRWNISDEYFMRPFKKVISMLAVRPSWGIVGNQPGSEGLMYNMYSSQGSYGKDGQFIDAIAPTNLKLTSLRWEKTASWNVGFNLNLFEDLLQFDLNIYQKKTTDLLMSGVAIPSTTGFASLAYANVGSMKNEGWELAVNTKRLFKIGKFSMQGHFNIAQNRNRITEMDESVLASKNADYKDENMSYLSRVQIGNALGSMYGFKYKGVYRYDYEHSGYFADEAKNTIFGKNTAAEAAKRGENSSCPIAKDVNGNIIYDAQGNPLPMYYRYGTKNYKFSGGDTMYEDINNDGQINELDVVYLGSSTPKFSGGFGLDFYYGRWTLKASFNMRVGQNVINLARQNAESMRSNKNQSTAVNWRWRKNGDITEIPRAMNSNAGDSWNNLANDRFVEKADFIRLQYLQLKYDFEPAMLKRFGISGLTASASGNNLFFLSKYKGVDPEHSQSGFGPCMDNSQTPVSSSFTFSLNVRF
ncbi:MAG: SusC/RagA family TonB-linked outer membrane protein [Bacteroidaceae bacterium]